MNINGLKLHQDVITIDQENELVNFINNEKWNDSLTRRTQHYGYVYDYRRKRVTAKSTPIPQIFKDILDPYFKLDDLTQILVNEYLPGQGIASHIDSTEFDDTIMSLSLISDTVMLLAKDKTKVNIFLPTRSLLVLQDDARYKWTHGIENKKIDNKSTINVVTGNLKPNFYLKRGKRISITIRKLKKEFNELPYEVITK